MGVVNCMVDLALCPFAAAPRTRWIETLCALCENGQIGFPATGLRITLGPVSAAWAMMLSAGPGRTCSLWSRTFTLRRCFGFIIPKTTLDLAGPFSKAMASSTESPATIL